MQPDDQQEFIGLSKKANLHAKIVSDALKQVPKGKVVSFEKLSLITANNDINPRSVGRSLKLIKDLFKSNYHRVVYKDGHLNQDYPGGKTAQKLRLKSEGIEFDCYDRVKMTIYELE